jgi:hypothetical protein
MYSYNTNLFLPFDPIIQTLAPVRSSFPKAPSIRSSQTKNYYPNSPKPGSPLTASLTNPRVVHTLQISSTHAKNGATARLQRPPRAVTTQRQRQETSRHKRVMSRMWRRRQNQEPRLRRTDFLLANGCPSSLPRSTHNNDSDPLHLPPKMTPSMSLSMPPPLPPNLTITFLMPQPKQPPLLLPTLHPPPRQLLVRRRTRQSKCERASPNYLVANGSFISRAKTRGLPSLSSLRSPSRHHRRRRSLMRRENDKGRNGRFVSDSGGLLVATTSHNNILAPSPLIFSPGFTPHILYR